MRWLLAVVAGALGVVTAAGDVSGAPIAPDVQVRSVDVTRICEVAGAGGFYEVDVYASPRRRTPTYDVPGVINVTTGGGLGPEILVSIAGQSPSGRRGGVSVNRKRCGATRARVPVSDAGLPGPAAVANRGYDCDTPRRVIVRVRATLRTAGAWVVSGDERELRTIRRSVVTATVVVRSWPARRALVYASLDSRGNTRLLAARHCR